MAALRDVSVILLAIESFVLLLIPAIILGACVYGVRWLRYKLPPLFAQARKYLTQAKAANARVGTDEVAHNLAVMDLADGNVDAAIAQFDRLSAKLPEALVNLGIAYERKGDPQKALDAWRRARKAGVRFPPLGDWIEAKERIYGEAP